MLKIKSTLALLALLAGVTHAAPDAKEILLQADMARGGGLPGLTWSIELEARDEEGEQKRSMTVKADANNNIVEFLAPEKVKGQQMVMQGRNMWFVRPGLSKPVPMSPRQRLIGMASNGDVASTNYSGDYNAKLLAEASVNNEDCYQLELSAANKGVTYDKILYWVSKKRGVGVKAEFYTLSGKLFKFAEFDYGNEIRHDGRKIPFVSKMTIHDAIDKSKVTTLAYSAIKVVRIDPAIFNLNIRAD
ncbi:MAG: outer membrane lipoprotein-sorting protein [Chitinivorax sp.]